MNKILCTALAGCTALAFTACSNNRAAENKTLNEAMNRIEAAKTKAVDGPSKPDGVAVVFIETERYRLKIHRAFLFESKGSDVLANTKPKEGYKFVALDLSLRNTGTEKLDGGSLLLAMRLTDDNGTECKRSLPALAMFNTQFPEEANKREYDGLWSNLAPGEFHRTVLCIVEVPTAATRLDLQVPADKLRKEWKQAAISL